ncbi:ABC transporter substrate-binding protein [Pyrococcus abyssi]|uniref:Putative trehalose/maltose binding protein or spermidine/putrescine-binding periplasmic n=1 Tax=Pyrococcus abyssi (strain GE5 / Orsay) TaxID=272844 RepID=Q9V2P8_PYRAB|nr:ABC transporter substrate-binding protein [Pyrococcus abyssi]CAB48950.1 Bacterial type extracellular binding protein, substrate unknown [Pyrococcus abyssi GE5]CCE69395.1 TPA: putative trehalose/maltose binding protein or spermidine/putrescine-binding periplasmic [Pyrococcus abyssi GE5]
MDRYLKVIATILLGLVVVASGCIGGGEVTKVVWASTQFTPPQERAFVLDELIPGFKEEVKIDVEFIPLDYPDLATRLEAEESSGKVTIDVIADLHGGLDYFNAKGWLEDLSGKKLEGRTFIESYMKYATDKNGKLFYIPWMSATYVMVVNKEAFKYLPSGLTEQDVIQGTEKWTYDALLAWVKNIYERTGKKAFGLPAGPKGLLHRFIHGYLYPSFTGYEAKKFDSSEAIEMWNYFKELWKYTNPASTTWDTMADPLLQGEVLIAWDHTARIRDAIETKPEEFVVVPVPRGPKGRGFIVVLAGLAIPKNAPHPEEAWKLIDYLTRPETQVKVLKEVGFFPTVKEAVNAVPEGPLKILVKGVTAQSSTRDALIVMIPNLGAKGGEFSGIYREAFKRIVLKGEDPQKVLSELGPKLHQLFKEQGVEEP